MTNMFSDSAQFSELLEQPEPLKVSKVVHKAFIEVNEEGAEAAAATGTQSFSRFVMVDALFVHVLSLCFSRFGFVC